MPALPVQGTRKQIQSTGMTNFVLCLFLESAIGPSGTTQSIPLELPGLAKVKFMMLQALLRRTRAGV